MDWIVNPVGGFQRIVGGETALAACDNGSTVLNVCACNLGLISCNRPGDLVNA